MSGVRPRLLNPTKVKVEQIDSTKTQYDHLHRESKNFIRRNANFEIEAQIKWVMYDTSSDTVPSQGGVDETQMGYMIVRQKDLDLIGKTIKRTDKIIEIGGKVVNLFVYRVDFGSHYDGEFRLVKVNFTDRQGVDG